MTIAFIINPKAGTKKISDLKASAEKILDSRQHQFKIFTTAKAGDAFTLAIEAANSGYNMIVAVGGDGTVNEVAKAVQQTGKTLGVIPTGSGNGFARHCKIPLNITEAMDVIAHGKILRMDTFLVNDLFSLNVSGIGFEAHIAHEFAKTKERGFLNYAKLVFREFRNYNSVKAKIIFGENIIEKEFFSMAFANSSQYGNNAQVAPGASLIDEKLNLVLIEKVPSIRAPFFLWQLFTGEVPKSSLVETYSFTDVRIECKDTVPLHIDGDAAGLANTFDVSINRAALNVQVPVATYYL